jgi:NAD(P)-dependent dehydrogenase (short-subunit alcohol dehydrogenase family)
MSQPASVTPGARLAVVTGGTTGIGRAIALTLARGGWDVAINDLGAPDAGAATTALLEAQGVRAFYRICDVGARDDVHRYYDELALRFGKSPDLLVNNAGIQTWAPLLELSEESWDRVIRTNLKGCFLNTQRVAQLMVRDRKGGSIVNIGSGCNKFPFPNLVDYTASKGGIEQFTKVAAIELGAHGIRVNCVAPGAIETERTQQEAKDYAGTWARITPLQRVGQPEDVAAMVAFLAGDQATFITGQTILVDGGVFTRPNWPYP